MGSPDSLRSWKEPLWGPLVFSHGCCRVPPPPTTAPTTTITHSTQLMMMMGFDDGGVMPARLLLLLRVFALPRRWGKLMQHLPQLIVIGSIGKNTPEMIASYVTLSTMLTVYVCVGLHVNDIMWLQITMSIIWFLWEHCVRHKACVGAGHAQVPLAHQLI